MTPDEWLACTDPGPMLDFLRGKASARKLRLFAVACCRRFWQLLADDRSKRVVEVAERFANGLATDVELGIAGDAAADALDAAMTSALVPDAVASAASAASNLNLEAARAADYAAAGAASAAFHLATALGAPSASAAREGERAAQCRLLREIIADPFRPVAINPGWVRWNDATVPKIARRIYDERDFSLMPFLADALEDAGCEHPDLLRHCREPAEHVRGCWLLDLVLGMR
jgi:hypothetical protein